MDTSKYFIVHNLKNTGWEKAWLYEKNMQSGLERFTLISVAYVAVDFKKVVSDLSHAGLFWQKGNASRQKRGYRNGITTARNLSIGNTELTCNVSVRFYKQIPCQNSEVLK